MDFKSGDVIAVHSLVSRADLNGRGGVVLSTGVGANGNRIGVMLEGEPKPKALHARNLRRVEQPSASKEQPSASKASPSPSNSNSASKSKSKRGGGAAAKAPSPSRSNAYFSNLVRTTPSVAPKARAQRSAGKSGPTNAAVTCKYYASEAGCRFGNRCRALHAGAPTKPVRLEPRALMLSERASLHRFVAEHCTDAGRFDALLAQLTPSAAAAADRRRAADAIRAAFAPFLRRALVHAQRDIVPAAAAPSALVLDIFGSQASGLWMPRTAAPWAPESDLDFALVDADAARRRAERWWARDGDGGGSGEVGGGGGAAAGESGSTSARGVHDLTTCSWSNRWWVQLHRAAKKAGALEVTLIPSAKMPVLKMKWPLGARASADASAGASAGADVGSVCVVDV